MQEWWNNLDGFERILWCTALAFSLFFVLQLVISMFVGDGDSAYGDSDDAIGHDDGIDFQFLTIKNMITFFTMFGWVGLACYEGGLGKTVSVLCGFVAGAVTVYIMFILFKNISKLKHSGTLVIANAVGKTADVYLHIPAKRDGFGKVHITLQGSMQELDAMTDDAEAIATGKMVKVVDVVNERVLIVTKI